MATENAKYIVLEGGEGSGKDTQLPLVQQWLVEQGITVHSVREPYDRILGPHMIALLKDADPTKAMTALDPWQQALIYSCARRGILKNEVSPQLARGHWILSSRNYTSTIVSQGYAAELNDSDMHQLRELCKLGSMRLEPDLTIILDLDPKIGRKRQESKDRDAFENSDISFLQRVRAGYLSEAKVHNYPVIDASRSIEAVTADIIELIKPLVGT